MSKTADDNFEFQKVIVVLGFSLMAVKFIAYWLTESVAILTDATESIVNVVAACIGMYALYLSAQPPDRSHPFGYGKIEIISSAIEGTMIIIAGGLVILESIDSFFNPGEIQQLDVGLVLVALAAVANYVVGRMAIRKGRKNRSPALEASGKHLCSDTYSSIGIFIGLGVVYLAESMGHDMRWLDSSIAVVFGIIIMVTGIGVLKKSAEDTMDRADESLLSDVSALICEYRHDDWIDVFNLRLIKYGPKIYIDMKIVLPKSMTIGQEDMELREVTDAVRGKFGDNVEMSITAVPCREYDCAHCERNCFERKSEFVSLMDWNSKMLCYGKPHCHGDLVEIDEGR